MKSPIVAFFLLLAAPCLHAQNHASHQHSFRNAEKWARVFDDPARDAWQKPHEVIQALQLKPDAVVADLGAGTGYFSARLAHMLPKGTIYAQDIEPDMVRYLAERARRDKLPNLHAVAGTPDDPRLPAKVDLALLVDVYHHIDHRPRFFANLRTKLNPGGRVAVIDFTPDAPNGPPKAARIALEVVKKEMLQAGYAVQAEHGFLPQQYFVVFVAR